MANETIQQMNPATKITPAELKEMHKQAFIKVSGEYPKGHCTGGGWHLRIHPGGMVVLVSELSIKNPETGEWADFDYTTAL